MSSALHQVQEFWNENPCGSKTVEEAIGSREFFREYAQRRYATEPYILELLRDDDVASKTVVEIGCGMGTDGVQLAGKGARYIGADLTPMGALLTRRHLQANDLTPRTVNASVESLPLRSESVDFVYSHGVLHHTPDIDRAVAEVHRVLRPGGRVHLMLYHKNSYNYWISIMILRRLGALLLLFPGGIRLAQRLTKEPVENLEIHKKRFKSQGLRYLFGAGWLNRNTDGANSPLARVYSRRTAKQLLRGFSDLRFRVVNINKRHIPIIGRILPAPVERWLGSAAGWHLHIYAKRT